MSDYEYWCVLEKHHAIGFQIARAIYHPRWIRKPEDDSLINDMFYMAWECGQNWAKKSRRVPEVISVKANDRNNLQVLVLS